MAAAAVSGAAMAKPMAASAPTSAARTAPSSRGGRDCRSAEVENTFSLTPIPCGQSPLRLALGLASGDGLALVVLALTGGEGDLDLA